MASDSLQLVSLIKNEKFHLEIYEIVQDILAIARVLGISFIFVSRSDNKESYSMAKSALNVVPTNRVSSFSNIQKRSQEAFEKLNEVQSRLHSRPFEEEKVAHESWIFWAEVEESFFMAKSRILLAQRRRC